MIFIILFIIFSYVSKLDFLSSLNLPEMVSFIIRFIYSQAFADKQFSSDLPALFAWSWYLCFKTISFHPVFSDISPVCLSILRMSTIHLLVLSKTVNEKFKPLPPCMTSGHAGRQVIDHYSSVHRQGIVHYCEYSQHWGYLGQEHRYSAC